MKGEEQWEQEFRSQHAYAYNHGRRDFVELAVLDRQVLANDAKTTKLNEINMKGQQAYLWWCRDGEAEDGYRTRLEDSLEYGPGGTRARTWWK